MSRFLSSVAVLAGLGAILGAAIAYAAAPPAPAPAAQAARAPGAVPLPPPENRRLARDIFRELVEIESTHEKGTREAARAVEKRLLAAGFAREDVHYLAPKKYPHQANIVVRLRGKGQAKPILYICHLDVVPANAADWSLPPYKLTEQDGYFYGRGASDMKNEDSATLAALIRLKQEGYVPDRDIIVAFTADEEVGLDENGVAFLLREYRKLVDAEFVINPDGGSGAMQKGRRLFFGIQTGEKVYVTYTAETFNRGGHSSEPRPDNAIYQLASGLVRFARYQFPFQNNVTTRSYFRHMARLNTGQTRDDMIAVSKEPMDLAAAARLARDPSYNNMLRTTCVATQLSGGHAENALPQRARAIIQCRIMPADTIEKVRRMVEIGFGDPNIKVTLTNRVVSGKDTTPSPAVIASIEKTVRGMWGPVMVMQVMSAGASDSLYTSSAGLPSYGVGGSWGEIGDGRAHGKDERTSVKGFYEGLEFTYRLMKELSTVRR
jgi:acetylornithine deacetylase/succinyl-diaminopimelate desuccinylase-like protein